MNLYSKNSAGDHQGLLIDEATGRTVALAYDASETAELARRWNAFESGGEVERLRAAVDGVDFDDVISSIQCHGNDRCTSEKDWGEVDGMIRSLRVLIEVRAALAQEPAHAKA